MNNISQENTGDLSSSKNDYQVELNSLPPLLPRSAWNSQMAFLKVVFRAKKALDKIEKETSTLKS
jgi:hypothetical protein